MNLKIKSNEYDVPTIRYSNEPYTIYMSWYKGTPLKCDEFIHEVLGYESILLTLNKLFNWFTSKSFDMFTMYNRPLLQSLCPKFYEKAIEIENKNEREETDE